MNYNVTTGKKLVIGYKYDAGGDSIVFTGYTKKEDESVVYLKFYNGENYLIPLVDMAVEIGSPLTDKTGVFPMQLVEILDGALIKNSPVWYGVVKNSLDQSTVTEVTTPELNLVYAQMYEAYQNILEIQETLVTAQNFDDMMAEYLEDHTIPVGVTSVNGLYGDVVLGAGQVGAIPAETVTQEDTTSSAAPGSQGTFEAVSEVYRNEYGQITGVDTVTVTMPTIPAETSRTDTTSTASTNIFSVIDEIETNEYGHVTAVNTKTVTVPSSGGGGGGTGAGEFVITVTKSGNTYTADRTGEEIQAAMEDGLVPILLEASNAVSGLAYHLSTYNQNLWVFDRPMSATKVAEFVLQGATPTITYTELTQTVDNALSSTSTNPVQNQAITTAISGLTADDIQDDSTVTTSGTVKDALRALSGEIANESTTRSEADASLRTAIDNLVSPTGQSVVVDSSLSISGSAADAKVTGDSFEDVDDKRDNLIYGIQQILAKMQEEIKACYRDDEVITNEDIEYIDTLIQNIESVTPTLQSISATYSGGDVVAGTPASELTGIAVTGLYSNGKVKTLNDWTISGTIAEGENTLTITYENKTTTITVTGVAATYGLVIPQGLKTTLTTENRFSTAKKAVFELKIDEYTSDYIPLWNVTTKGVGYNNGVFASTGVVSLSSEAIAGISCDKRDLSSIVGAGKTTVTIDMQSVTLANAVNSILTSARTLGTSITLYRVIFYNTSGTVIAEYIPTETAGTMINTYTQNEFTFSDITGMTVVES